MIKTATLNIAIDKTVQIDNLTIDTVNRVKSVRLDAGGKGINVSKIIKSLGGDSTAIGIISGNNGAFIKSQLEQENIHYDFVESNGETRINLKIVDTSLGTHTDVNEQGVPVSNEIIHQVEEKMFDNLEEGSILVISGSAPPLVPKDIYRKWVEKANRRGVKTILDADGTLLKEGIKAGPYIIKPNIDEMERLINKKINSIEEAIEEGRKLLNYGIHMIVISLGKDGSIFITKEKAIQAKGIEVQAKSTVGAGDSMIGAIALSLTNNDELEDMIKLAVATATAKVMAEGTQCGDIEDIHRFKEQVSLKYYT